MIRVNGIEIGSVKVNGVSVDKVTVNGGTEVFGGGGGSEDVAFDLIYQGVNSWASREFEHISSISGPLYNNVEIDGAQITPIKVLGANLKDVEINNSINSKTQLKRVDDYCLLLVKGGNWEGGHAVGSSSQGKVTVTCNGEQKELSFNIAINENREILSGLEQVFDEYVNTTFRAGASGETMNSFYVRLFPSSYTSNYFYEKPLICVVKLQRGVDPKTQGNYQVLPLEDGVDFDASSVTGGVLTNIRLDNVDGVGSLNWKVSYSVSPNYTGKYRELTLLALTPSITEGGAFLTVVHNILQEYDSDYRIYYNDAPSTQIDALYQKGSSKILPLPATEYVFYPEDKNYFRVIFVPNSIVTEYDLTFKDTSGANVYITPSEYVIHRKSYTCYQIGNIIAQCTFTKKQ